MGSWAIFALFVLTLSACNPFSGSIAGEDFHPGIPKSGAVLQISDGDIYNYGSVVVSTQATKSFLVTNTGSSSARAIQITGLSLPFSRVGGNCGDALPKGATCTLLIGFLPTSFSPQSGTLRISYTGGKVSNVTRALIGDVIGASGTLDITFSNNGETNTNTFPVGADWAGGNYIALQTDGKIVAAGAYFATNFISNFGLVRYLTDGTIDNSFGSAGFTATAFGTGAWPTALAIQTDGKLIIGGYVGIFYTLARYRTDGTLDSSFGLFGSSSLLLAPVGTSGSYPNAIMMQTDGKILGGGIFVDTTGTSSFVVTRLLTNGNPDNSFGSSGHAITALGTTEAAAKAVAIQPDGKIVASGHYTNSTATHNFAVARYLTNGTLDTSFGSSGVVTTPIGTLASDAESLLTQPDGKIVVAGKALASFSLVRYGTNGAPDAFFGSGGIVTTLGSFASGIQTLSLQSGGNIIAAGYYGFAGVGLRRYFTDGSLDPSFGTNGLTTVFVLGNLTPQQSSFIQSDGKIIITNSISHPGPNYNEQVLRFWP